MRVIIISFLILFFGCSPKTVEFSRSGYEGVYSLKHHQSIYVKHILKKEDVEGLAKRKNDFRVDTLLDTLVSLSNYYKSGYDRGHLKPAADSKLSQEEMSESFLLTNISPQFPQLNRVTWRKIEQYTRSLLATNDSLIVYTGTIIKRKGLGKLNGSKITIPQAFYKVIVQMDSTVTGFICPNDSVTNKIFDYSINLEVIKNLPFFRTTQIN